MSHSVNPAAGWLLGVALSAIAGTCRDVAGDWPQFRGPGGLGVAAADAKPPIEFGPTNHVRWKIALPSGNSSPIVWKDRIFLTAFDAGKLLTIALHRETGRELWRREVTPQTVEEVHRSLGSPASATPATDGNRIYVHFGSFGAIAYDLDGKEAWRREMTPTETEYGASSSPIVAGENVILLLDQDGGSHLLAINRRTGKVAWRVERPEMRRGFGTPILWSHDGVDDLIVPGTLWLKAHDPASGAERWRVKGLARITCTSPAAGDGLLFTASWTTGGDHNADHLLMPKFDEFAAQNDANHDGKFTLDELPQGPVKQRFKHLDGSRDGFISREEWESMAEIFDHVENQAFAVKAGGQAALSESNVVWRFKRGLPYVASPVYYAGRFYMVKNGGMLTCLDPRSGKPAYLEERLGALGDYYASLVAADGRIYASSQPGVVTVVKAGDTFEVLARNSLGEGIQATPAIVGESLLVRTATQLYSFDSGPAAR